MASMQINRNDLSFEEWRTIQTRRIKLYLKHHNIKNHKCNWTKLGTYLGNIRGDKAKILYFKFLQNTLIKHGNKGREPHNKTSTKKVNNFIKEYKKFLNHIQIYLKSRTFIPSLTDLNYEFMIDQKFSLASMYRFCNKSNLVSRNTTKRKRKEIRKKLRELSKTTNQIKPNEHLVLKNHSNYQSSSNVSHYEFGEVVEIDATSLNFYNGQKIWAYGAVDAKTSSLLAIWFDVSENNFGYQMLLKRLFRDYGLPKILFSDNRKGIDPRDKKAIIAGLIKGLDIILLTSSVSQDKPHVERAWRNGNSWFPTHFTKQNYQKLEQLQHDSEILAKKYNKRYKYFPGKQGQGVFRKTKLDLSKFYLKQYIKTVQKGECIKIHKDTYAPFAWDDNLEKRVSITVGFQVVIHHNTKSNNYWIIANNKTYHLKKTSKFQNTLELIKMANQMKKIWGPRKIADNAEISLKQKHIWANIEKQRSKLNIKERQLNTIENWLKTKIKKLRKFIILKCIIFFVKSYPK